MKNVLLLLLATLALSTVKSQDLVITKQQDTLHCKVLGRPQGKVVISFPADGITIDSTLDASTVQRVIFDAHTVGKTTVPIRVTTTGDTIYGKLIFENDSLQYFRHNGVTQAVPKKLLQGAVNSSVPIKVDNSAPYASGPNSEANTHPQQQLYLGYQIGGATLAGLDLVLGYPVGVHVGLGFMGYTFGIRFYPKPQNSLNINMSFKDGGFGLINLVGLEVGGNMVSLGKRGGIHIQGGFGIITNIDPAFSEELFDSDEPPQAMLTLGIGFKLL